MRTRSIAPVVALFATAGACASPAEDTLDPQDSQFLVAGKADGEDIDPGEACALLKLASSASLEVLDDDATLNAKAARAIVAARAGEDGVAGTADDVGFATLAALDDVKYIGPAAFKKLRAYAAANDEWACGQTTVQLLAINDFHGALQPPTGSGGSIVTVPAQGTTPAVTVAAGGAEYLATHLAKLAETNPNTLVVGAGDMIGATPLLSAAFHDEPTIEALNLMKLAVTSVGNHEFDEGLDELLRMQYGGCHEPDGCYTSENFKGADWTYLAANVVEDETGDTIFPATTVRWFGKTPVAFIGLTLEGTPLVVTEAGVRGLTFFDEAETINALVPDLQAQGIETIVVLIHEGGAQTGLWNECAGASGPILDIVQKLDPAIDAVVSGHTHNAYNCNINGRLLTSGAHNGRLVTDINLTIDEATGDVVTEAANNVIVTRDVTADKRITDLIAKYNAIIAPIANRVVGSAAGDLVRTASPAGETSMGDVIADAQLAATDDPTTGQAVIALMNPGGVRGDILAATISGGEKPGEITYAEAFTVQPFANNLITMTLTGAQIERVLEEQWFSGGKDRSTKPMILAPSAGFTYTWDAKRSLGDWIDPTSIKLGGQTIDPNASYRVTVNVFLSTGGDGFATLKEGTDRLSGPIDLDALEAYLKDHPTVAVPPADRIIAL